MRKYGGVVIYQSHDDDGILEVVDMEGMRSLHFGSESKQSCMMIQDPYSLELTYVRAMMCWNLFKNHFDNIMVIGLGGGSLAKYLLHSYPKGIIRVIENRKSVVRVARGFFGLPQDNRLEIIVADGGEHIRVASTETNNYDLIFVDAYDHEAMSESVNGSVFFDGCRSILCDSGIMVINLWKTDRAYFEQTVSSMERSFDNQLLFLPVRGRGNVIGFGFNQKTPEISGKKIKKSAASLEMNTQIEYPVFVRDLKKYNSKVNHQIL